MRQYDRIKEKYPNTIVFFQLGDFYETFYNDAKITSKVLDIALTSRGIGSDGERIPLAGIPIKAIDTYLGTMVKNGYKVAIVDQLEDAKKATGKIVKRGVTRVVTPGTVFESSILNKKTNNYLLSIAINESKQKIGFALVDISTGEFSTTEFQENIVEQFQNEFMRFKPQEVLFTDSIKREKIRNAIEKIVRSQSNVTITPVNETMFNYESGRELLMSHFQVASLAAFGCESMIEGTRAAGAILNYLSLLKDEYPTNITTLRTLDNSKFLILDSNTQRNLEITENAFDGKIEGSLLSIFTDINTSMGARLLRKWLLQPLKDPNDINNRLDAIEELVENYTALDNSCVLLSQIADFERIIAKIVYNTVNARDLLMLAASINFGLNTRDIIQEYNFNSQVFHNLIKINYTILSKIASYIETSIVESPPISIKEGGIIDPNFSQELKELQEIKSNQNAILKKIEDYEQNRTSFNLKMGYNSVHGYYIEVTKAQLRDAGEEAIPADYIRRQTLVNAERFITPKLKEIEEKILNIDERIQELEFNLFCQIRERITTKLPIIREFAQILAELDVLLCFSNTTLKNKYCRPKFLEHPVIQIKGGRHAVVELIQKETGFIPNSTQLEDGSLHIITGPNMSGKSTYIRQVALIVLLAQSGCFVPADECQLGIIDRIFTRVGAFDRLAFGQSTFMLEMLETAYILNNATSKSLIILDEVGRGTSTYDGLSLAWAIAEHIAKEVQCKTLFATHYHQLSELEKEFSCVENYHQTARERNGELVLLYKIKPGSTDHSFGISVAKMAGIPQSVIFSAQKKLFELENTLESNPLDKNDVSKSKQRYRQLSLAEAFSKNINQQKYEKEITDLKLEILAFLKNYSDIDVNYKTPIEALQKLEKIVQEIKEFERKIKAGK